MPSNVLRGLHKVGAVEGPAVPNGDGGDEAVAVQRMSNRLATNLKFTWPIAEQSKEVGREGEQVEGAWSSRRVNQGDAC